METIEARTTPEPSAKEVLIALGALARSRSVRVPGLHVSVVVVDEDTYLFDPQSPDPVRVGFDPGAPVLIVTNRGTLADALRGQLDARATSERLFYVRADEEALAALAALSTPLKSAFGTRLAAMMGAQP